MCTILGWGTTTSIPWYQRLATHCVSSRWMRKSYISMDTKKRTTVLSPKHRQTSRLKLCENCILIRVLGYPLAEVSHQSHRGVCSAPHLLTVGVVLQTASGSDSGQSLKIHSRTRGNHRSPAALRSPALFACHHSGGFGSHEQNHISLCILPINLHCCPRKTR